MNPVLVPVRGPVPEPSPHTAEVLERVAYAAEQRARERERERDRPRRPYPTPAGTGTSPRYRRHRCRAWCWKRGRRCRRWAMHGQDVCASHGGRAPQARRAASRRVAQQDAAKLLAKWKK